MPPPTHTHTHIMHTSSQLEVCNFPYSVYFRFLKFLYTDQVDSENLTLDETISKSANSLQQVATPTLLAVSTDTIVHTVKRLGTLKVTKVAWYKEFGIIEQ